MTKWKGKLKGEALRSFQRGKYGPSRKPAPVIVKKADGSEHVVSPWAFEKKKRKKR